MMRSTFAGFSTATLALCASQRALEVTGQNISNVNTPGYTRQRLDIQSLYLRGGEFYNSNPNSRIGFGVEITGVSQLRDPLLDNQYRTQMAKLGTTDAQVSGFEKLAQFLDETNSTGIKDALANLNSQLQNLSVNPNSKEFDSMVKSACQQLLNLFHQNAEDLKGVRDDLSSEFTDTTVKDANEILKNLAELNETIRNSQILGNPALELKDQRNELIDELASYLPITVKYRDEKLVSVVNAKDPTDEMVSRTIEELDIYFIDNTGTKHLLVSDNKYGSFSASGLSGANEKMSQIAALNEKISNLKAQTPPDTAAIAEAETQRQEIFDEVKEFLNVNDPSGAKGKVELGADGEVTYTATDANGKDTVHNIVQGSNFSPLEAKNLVGDAMRLSVTTTDRAGNLTGPKEITDNITEGVMKGTLDVLNKSGGFDTPPTDVNGIGYYEQTLDSLVAKFAEVFNELNADPDGKEDTPLFEKIDPNKPFSVSNIKIADGWANNKYGVRTSKDKVPGEGDDVVGSTADDNVLKMIEALSASQKFERGDGSTFYNGTFYNCFTNMENVLNIDLKAAKNTLDNKITVINQTADLKDAISGVSLDEEGINLLHYQQSYSAAARLMTTLDEALDKLINGTGVVGR